MKGVVKMVLGVFLGTTVVYSSVVGATVAKNIQQEMQTFGIKTSATRIIYNPASQGASLTVINPQDYPMLVQSTVVDSDKKTPAPFIVTPPLFRLDGNKQNVIHLVSTGNVSKPNQESLYWLCLMGVPPNDNSAWAPKPKNSDTATLLTQMRINTCLKVFVRPSSLSGTSTDVANKLTWSEKGNTLTVKNPTPFYMNFSSITVSKTSVPIPSYVAPFSSQNIKLKSPLKGTVNWSIITDSGGNSQTYQAPITLS